MIHPGPHAAERSVAVPASLQRISGVLPAGRTVMTAVARLFADAGCKGGVVWLDGATWDQCDMSCLRLRLTGSMPRGIRTPTPLTAP